MSYSYDSYLSMDVSRRIVEGSIALLLLSLDLLLNIVMGSKVSRSLSSSLILY